MNTLTTNIIRNVINIGGSNACDAGPQYCQEGYSLYFPCLKDVTKGQNVCFDFYVADNATKDVIDLRDVDAITLSLTGAFGCSYGDFSYPDNISSLQTEKYPVVYENDFGRRRLCHLDLTALSVMSDDIINSKESDFFTGMEVEVSAYDTPTHIFIGWVIGNQDDEPCDEETWDDIIASRSNVYRFIMDMDINIFALYRPRKVYKIISDPSNKSSHFIIDYNHIRYHLSHRPEEICNDEFEHLDEVIEGYHMVAECVPNVSALGGDSDDDYTYVFKQWKDENTDRYRLFTVGVDTKSFESGDTISLYAKCTGPVPIFEQKKSVILYNDDFDEDAIHINTEFNPIEFFEFYGDECIKDSLNTYLLYIDDEGFLQINDGYLKMSSLNIEDGVKINIYAKGSENCEISLSVNDLTTCQTIDSSEFKLYEFYFHKCDMSDIELNVNGECIIDKIEICKEEIIDKGKATLCLDSEITSNLPSGPLSVSGAVMVNGQSYGLANASIGSVNKLKKITIV